MPAALVRCTLALLALGLFPQVLRGAEEPPAAAVRAAAEKGIAFLNRDAALWREERTCSACHHGLLTTWVHQAAKRRGVAVDPETAAETLNWTKDRLLARIDLPRDERPGWSMVNTQGIYFGWLGDALPGQDAVTRDEMRRIARHLLRHQEPNGSWVWSAAPPKNRPPPFFESDELATRLAMLALIPRASDPAESPEAAAENEAIQAALARAGEWLKQQPPSDTTQASAVRVLMLARTGAPPEQQAAALDELRGRRNSDGGWGQLRGRGSDAYATGQVLSLLALSQRELPAAEREQAAAFLIKSQRDDGSWETVPRSHEGAEPASNPGPITHFGSAWGVMGLLSQLPEARGGP